jgi:predicted HicB family RNase H-like nuclease
MSYYEYKGYYGSCKVSVEDNCLHGKIEFIDDLVNYEAETAEELKKEFMLAVDDYLEHCKAIGKTPNQTCKGSFNVRIGSELHQKLVLKAEKAGKSLNDYIKSIVEQDVNPSS